MRNLKELNKVEVSIKVEMENLPISKDRQLEIEKKVEELIKVINPNLITVNLAKLAAYSGIFALSDSTQRTKVEAVFVAIPKEESATPTGGKHD